MTGIAFWRIRPRLILAFVGVLLPREKIIKPQLEQMRRESKERS